LEFEGVKNYDVVKSNKINGAQSTYDEAVDMIRYVKTHHIKKFIIVTDNFHTGRALYFFKSMFKKNGLQNVVIEVDGVYNRLLSKENWYRNYSGIIVYFQETIKALYYILLC